MSRVSETERDKVQAMDCESWRFFMQKSVRNGMMLKSANAFMKRMNYGELKLIRKFMRMRVDIGIG